MCLALVEAFHACRRRNGHQQYSDEALVRLLNALPTSDRLIVPGFVRHRRLPLALACLSTPAVSTTAAAVRDVSSGAAPPRADVRHVVWDAVLLYSLYIHLYSPNGSNNK